MALGDSGVTFRPDDLDLVTADVLMTIQRVKAKMEHDDQQRLDDIASMHGGLL